MRISPLDRQEHLIYRADSYSSITEEACQTTRTELDAAEKVNKRLGPSPLQAIKVYCLNSILSPLLARPLKHQPQQQHSPSRRSNNSSNSLRNLAAVSSSSSSPIFRITYTRVVLILIWITWMLFIPRFITDTATILFLDAVHPYNARRMHRFVFKNQVLHPKWHPATRKERFPSVDKRVQGYMGPDWYALPPCLNYTDGKAGYRSIAASDGGTQKSVQLVRPRQDAKLHAGDATIELHHNVIPDAVFILLDEIVHDCARSFVRYYLDQYLWGEHFWQSAEKKARVSWRMNMRVYCGDCLEMLDIIHTNASSSTASVRGSDKSVTSHRNTVPILVQSGDRDGSKPEMGSIPVFKKFRRLTPNSLSSGQPATSSISGSGVTCRSQPAPPHVENPRFIWKLNSRRHFHPVQLVPYEDRRWERKKNMAVWRGAVTGYLGNRTTTSSTTTKKDEHVCFDLIPRCKFVYENGGSRLLDAKFHKNVDSLLPHSLNGVSLFALPLSKKQLMSYKAIIILEGNDVSSALKWALFSNSVVIMPAPTTVSWALEHLLVPWIHYVPLESKNLKQAEERMAWVLAHDEEARRISERATLFIYDLMFHPDAMTEERAVKEEMMARYQQYFQKL
jgi:hypothetical protein